jgi:hypothetical protein
MMKKPRLNTPGACRKAQIAALTNSLEIKRQARAQRLDRAADFATVRSYSGVHRSGMISATGLSVRRQVTAHRHGVKRGARTSTVPNNDTNRRER